MKKVRYAIGALGAAPAIAFMTPTAHAASAATGAANTGKAGKSVSLIHAKMAQPDVTCGTSKFARSSSSRHNFSARVDYQGSGCIAIVSGSLSVKVTGLQMRVRLYSIHGTRTHQYLDDHTYYNIYGSPGWSIMPNVHAHQACEALVLDGTTSSVEFGPICETF